MTGRRLGFGGQMRAVWRKELTDALRDRRSLMTALLFPILMPLMMTLMFGALARLEGTDRPLEAPIAGRERAPNLVACWRSAGSSSSIRRPTPRRRCAPARSTSC